MNEEIFFVLTSKGINILHFNAANKSRKKIIIIKKKKVQEFNPHYIKSSPQ